MTTSYLSNLVIDRETKMLFFKHWTRKDVNLDYLRVWGCQVIMRKVDRLGMKEKKKGFLVGYDVFERS